VWTSYVIVGVLGFMGSGLVLALEKFHQHFSPTTTVSPSSALLARHVVLLQQTTSTSPPLPPLRPSDNLLQVIRLHPLIYTSTLTSDQSDLQPLFVCIYTTRSETRLLSEETLTHMWFVIWAIFGVVFVVAIMACSILVSVSCMKSCRLQKERRKARRRLERAPWLAIDLRDFEKVEVPAHLANDEHIRYFHDNR